MNTSILPLSLYQCQFLSLYLIPKAKRYASCTNLDHVSCSGPIPGSVAHQCRATLSQTSSDSWAPALQCPLEA